MSKPVLFSYWRSSCSWRVRAALEYKGIQYEYKPVNLLKKEQSTSEYKAMNSAGVVPSLTVDGNSLTESIAILEYLEEIKPEPTLLPADPIDRATVRAICQQIGSGIQPIQNLRVLQYLGKDKSQEWANNWITVGFDALEKMLEKSAGKYCFGDTVTMADCCLVPQVYNARRYNVDLSKYPLIERIDKLLNELETFKKAHPKSQPDCPEEERALSYKNINYEYRAVNLAQREHLDSATYRALNPAAKVPALMYQGHIIPESMAIMDWIENQYPKPSLLPANPMDRANVLALCNVIVSDIQPLQNAFVLLKVMELAKTEDGLKWAQHYISTGFTALETMLSKTAGKYSFGDTVTMADCCLVPQVHNARNRYKVDVSQYPTIERIDKSLYELAPFQISHPCKQPDYPGDENNKL